MKRFSAAGCALAVVLVSLLAHEAECGQRVYLGGEDVGWTHTSSIDYNKWLSDYKIKIGDTLIISNRDTEIHSIDKVDKLAYDTCGKEGTTWDSSNYAPGIQSEITFIQSGTMYIICSIRTHCIQGMKVAIQILNADGSVNKTAEAAESPRTNSALAMPGISWTSQLLVATVALVMAAIPVLSF